MFMFQIFTQEEQKRTHTWNLLHADRVLSTLFVRSHEDSWRSREQATLTILVSMISKLNNQEVVEIIPGHAAGDSNADSDADFLAAGSTFQSLCCSPYVMIVGLQNFNCVVFRLPAECMYNWLEWRKRNSSIWSWNRQLCFSIRISFTLPSIRAFKSGDRILERQGALVNPRVKSGVYFSHTNKKPKCPLWVISSLPSLCVLNKSGYPRARTTSRR